MINLQKGKGLNLNKGLTQVKMTCQWDSNADVDISCFVLTGGTETSEGQAKRDEDFIFYNNKVYPNGAVKHLGDCRDGSKTDGDDETIEVNLSKLEPDRNEVLFVISINNALEKNQHLGNIGKVVCTLYDSSNNTPLATYQCDNDLFGEIAGKLCKVVKDNDKWNFVAVGKGSEGLESMINEVGLSC